MARCAKCNAVILWRDMVTGGKMPVDYRSIKVVIPAADDSDKHRVVRAWISHFATCPNAADFRRRPPPRTA